MSTIWLTRRGVTAGCAKQDAHGNPSCRGAAGVAPGAGLRFTVAFVLLLCMPPACTAAASSHRSSPLD